MSYKSQTNTKNSRYQPQTYKRKKSTKKKEEINLFFKHKERAWNPSNKISLEIKKSLKNSSTSKNPMSSKNFNTEKFAPSLKQKRSKSSAFMHNKKPREMYQPEKIQSKKYHHSKNILSDNYVSNQIKGYIRKNQNFLDYKKNLKSDFLQKSLAVSRDKIIQFKQKYEEGGSGQQQQQSSQLNQGVGNLSRGNEEKRAPVYGTNKQNLKKTLREILSEKFQPQTRVAQRVKHSSSKNLKAKKLVKSVRNKSQQKFTRKISQSHEMRSIKDVSSIKNLWEADVFRSSNLKDISTIKKKSQRDNFVTRGSRSSFQKNETHRSYNGPIVQKETVGGNDNFRNLIKTPTVDTERYVHFKRNYRAHGVKSDPYAGRFSKTTGPFSRLKQPEIELSQQPNNNNNIQNSHHNILDSNNNGYMRGSSTSSKSSKPKSQISGGGGGGRFSTREYNDKVQISKEVSTYKKRKFHENKFRGNNSSLKRLNWAPEEVKIHSSSFKVLKTEPNLLDQRIMSSIYIEDQFNLNNKRRSHINLNYRSRLLEPDLMDNSMELKETERAKNRYSKSGNLSQEINQSKGSIYKESNYPNNIEEKTASKIREKNYDYLNIPKIDYEQNKKISPAAAPPKPQAKKKYAFNSTKISTKKNGVIESFAVNTISSKDASTRSNLDRVSVYFNYVVLSNGTKIDHDGNEITERVKVPFGFFGLYEGKGSSLCSDFMKKNLHHRIFKNRNFPKNVNLAITQGIHEAEKNFREWFIEKGSAMSQGRERGDELFQSGTSNAIIFINLGRKAYFVMIGNNSAFISKSNGKLFSEISSVQNDSSLNIQNRTLGGFSYREKIGHSNILMQNRLLDLDYLEITSFSLTKGIDFVLIPSSTVSKLWTKKELGKQLWRSIHTVINSDLSNSENNHCAAGNALNMLLGISSQKSPKKNFSCLIIFLNNLSKKIQNNQNNKK